MTPKLPILTLTQLPARPHALAAKGMESESMSVNGPIATFDKRTSFAWVTMSARMSTGRYISRRVSETACEGERFGADGFPIKCEDTPVFELMHSNGHALHICEYHIQF